ncbi:MAG TPA: hypothetical protein VNL71_24465 [Chloroflexota bacterium]|nr:hypothetical protein [Chloroflexota bacterium]
MTDRSVMIRELRRVIDAMLSRLLLLSVGPRAKWIVLALWLIPVVALANFSIKFNDVQSDNPALFTPSGAESTQATAILQDQFPGGRLAQAIVVYQRSGGLTTADQARIRADMASFHGAGLPPGVRPPPQTRRRRMGRWPASAWPCRTATPPGPRRLSTRFGRGLGTAAMG